MNALDLLLLGGFLGLLIGVMTVGSRGNQVTMVPYDSSEARRSGCGGEVLLLLLLVLVLVTIMPMLGG